MLVNFPYNPGYLLHQLTEQELEPIWNEVNCFPESGSDSSLHKPDKTFYLTDSHAYIENLLEPYVGEYIDGFQYGWHLDNANVTRQLRLTETWVTFQKSNDFNALHNHRGQLSFVIWLKVPYTFEQERSVQNKSQLDSGSKHFHGDFEFQWIDSIGTLRSHRVGADRELEGYLCIFPAGLHHQVFPYYSTDDIRISISGNWAFKID